MFFVEGEEGMSEIMKFEEKNCSRYFGCFRLLIFFAELFDF